MRCVGGARGAGCEFTPEPRFSGAANGFDGATDFVKLLQRIAHESRVIEKFKKKKKKFKNSSTASLSSICVTRS